MIIVCKVLNDSVPPIPGHLHLTANLNLMANKRTCCAVACVTERQGNLILCGPPINIKVMPRMLSQVMRHSVHSCTLKQRKNSSSYICCSPSGEDVTGIRITATSEWDAPTQSQGQACQRKCATAVGWRWGACCRASGCFTLIANQ